MRVTVTGATGLIGSELVRVLRARGDEVTVLSRSAQRAEQQLGDVEAHDWDLMGEPAPAPALEGRDAVVHLAGENVAQRWNAAAKERILESRVTGTRHLVDGIRAVASKPATLVTASGSGFYGPHGDEVVDETAPAGDDFLAEVCIGWEREARKAEELGVRVAMVRTGVVLSKEEGALKKMLLPFRLGVGGPVAGGRQYFPWISLADIIGLYLAALDDPSFSGPINGSSPEPVTNGQFSKALGRVLRRPAFAPVPGFALRALYGEMGSLVTTGVRMVPGRASELGYAFEDREVEAALRKALGT
ncbi:TIGR01777 family oxidoreductase [Conexibacter sp. SYSU D00693]|uniref:TIGR01777 family oxidoreductase n=1 Tax=Conexibacter sp. SYSU D00693 TaxID=2812560 RepID=UPI00196A95A5|nr:TIGR01777 family oxidoreductase [Conexibacter sp. SYSU D00693]